MKTLPFGFSPPEWSPPSSLPDLSEAKAIAIDLETCDPNLDVFGPGWPRKDGYIVGFAVAAEGWSGYFPIRHEAGGNLDRGIVERFIQKILVTDAVKVMHNAAYDIGWLRSSGFEVRGPFFDTMIAAALLDENRYSYSLNSLSYEYLKENKSEQGLVTAAKEFGVHPKKELWKLPALYVGEYAEGDAVLALKLWQQFKIKILEENLSNIFDLETNLLPVLLDLSDKGIRFDISRATRMIEELQQEEAKILKTIEKSCAGKIDIWASASIARGFDRLGIDYPRTAKGSPSFTKTFLQTNPHPVCSMILQARECNKVHSAFLQSYIEASKTDGRIHPHVNQIRSDDGGTITGRLSMSQPNLQQVPARHATLGPRVRSLFLPEENELWVSNDFASQEPRILMHYASLLGLEGTEEIVGKYQKDPRTDFYQIVADVAQVPRKTAKTISLGLMYGMGKAKLAESLEISVNEAEDLMKEFHKKAPFLRATIDAVQRRIHSPASGGSISTLLGRKCRFDLWEPVGWTFSRALPLAEAQAKYSHIRRAMTYKGLNRLIQGSAADQTKQAMIDLHKAGYRLLLQVHDEIALSLHNKEEARETARVMENAVCLKVPSVVDSEVGRSWGEAV
jgi:DNA polymerase I-like protein with 3'-5' exonuclease and polymerase domains